MEEATKVISFSPTMGTLSSASTKDLLTTTEEFSKNKYDTNEDLWSKEMERVVSIVVPIIFSLMFLVGCTGNSLVLYVVASNKNMRSPKNLLITNLAIADLLFIITCVPFSAAAYASPHNWLFGDTFCKIFQTTTYYTALVSVYTLVLISMERFLAISYPIRSISWRTNANSLIAIIITWAVLLVFCIPMIFSHSELRTLSNNTYCDFSENKRISILPESFDWRWNILRFKISFFVLGFLLPMLVMSGFYIIMFYTLWKQGPVDERHVERTKKNRKIVKLFLVVVIIFAICWTPIHVIMILRALRSYSNTPIFITIQIISHVLAYANSCLNPIIYGFLYEPFRQGLKFKARMIPPHNFYNN